MIREGLEWALWDTPLNLEEQSASPTVVPSNTLKIYAKDKSGVSALYYMGDNLVEKDLSGGLTGTGVANRLAYWTGATTLAANAALTATRVLFVDGSGLPTDDADLTFATDTLTSTKLKVGTGVTDDTESAIFKIKVTSDTDAPHFFRFGANAGSFWVGVGARGTIAAPSQTLANDVLSGVSGRGYDNQATPVLTGNSAVVALKAGENFTSTARGAYITLETTPLLSTTRAVRFRVGESGQWGIGGSDYGTAGNLFRSGGASAAPTWLDHTTDFLSQYALLAGRSGGQTLNGGTAANEDITIEGTSHATRTSSYVLLQPNGGFVCIGDSTPFAPSTGTLLQLENDAPGIFFRDTGTNPNEDHRIATIVKDVDAGSGNGSLFIRTLRNNLTVLSEFRFDVDGNMFLGAIGQGNISTTGNISLTTANATVDFTTGGRVQFDANHFFAPFDATGSFTLLTINTDPFRIKGDGTNSTTILNVDGTKHCLGIGTANLPTTGTFGLIFADGTALATMATNTAGLYADDISGNVTMHVINENGDIIKLYQQANSIALDDLVVNNGLRASGGMALFTAQLKFVAGNEATGAQAPLLGSNAPGTGTGLTNPYTWFKMTSSDGSQVYVPAWKLS